MEGLSYAEQKADGPEKSENTSGCACDEARQEAGGDGERGPEKGGEAEDATGADAIAKGADGDLEEGVAEQEAVEDKGHVALGEGERGHHQFGGDGEVDALDVAGEAEAE